MMKFHAAIILALFATILATPLTNNSNDEEKFNKISPRLPIMHDPYFPTDCDVPDCEKYKKAVKYPAPLARTYFQCAFDGKRWIPQIIPCPCDLVFSYKDQQCVYPWSIQKWCENEYIVDILPAHCE